MDDLEQQLGDLWWRPDPLTMAMHLDATVEDPAHIALLSEECASAALTPGTRTIFLLPPGHAKSTTCSKWAPSWFLGLFPERLVMLVSWGAEYAAGWGRKVRDVMDEHGDRLGARLREDSRAANRWNTHAGGGMVTAGVGGGIMGYRPHLVIVDDPIKDMAEAYSAVHRQRVWDWYTGTLRTRLEPGASMFVVMHRWHTDDLVGRLMDAMAMGGEQYRIIRLPALAEDGDPLGRAPGAPLWPGRWGLNELRAARQGVDGHGGITRSVWEARYQQNPQPEEGGAIKRSWWKLYETAPDRFDQVVQSWDLTFSDTLGSDFTVGQVWGRVGGTYYLLDQVRAHMDAPEQLSAIRNLTQRWPSAVGKLVEWSANGAAVIAMLQHEVSGLIPVKTGGRSKEARLLLDSHAVAPLIEAGNVHLPKRAPWTAEYIEEFAAFPGGAHDDQVDATTQALAHLSKYGRASLETAQREAGPMNQQPRTTEEWVRMERAKLLQAERKPGGSNLHRRYRG